ncbi:aspartate--ammonia ligase [candidate division KSB1 bacterium]|nr:aspartate--ammonia ligase [candidate division KSB1 bacterium]
MNSAAFIPKYYQQLLNLKDTEKAIRLIKNFFQVNLAFELNLMRVTAPILVRSGTGVNDDLNGVEKPVSFKLKSMDNSQAEIVQSLAKWKRMMLAYYGFDHGEGIYTDMNAIRPDEILDNLHSVYVDQWDWEKVITPEQRNLQFLKSIVCQIYQVIQRTERYIAFEYPAIQPMLPENITFLHAEELETRYPDLTPVQREKIVCQEYGAVFIIGIGGKLKNGQPHDGRAPDYDDWSTANDAGYAGLNGDICVYYPILDCTFELSSMGIRVDPAALLRQLELTNTQDRLKFEYHQRLMNGEFPLSIGGGIGQSRLCMFYLRKAHIGEIQAGIWPDLMIKQCRDNKIFLL